MWQPLTEPVVEDVHRVLAEVDVAFGNVVERSVADIRALLETGSFWGIHDADGSLCGVAGSVPDEECVLGLAASHPGRADLLAEVVPLLEEGAGVGLHGSADAHADDGCVCEPATVRHEAA